MATTYSRVNWSEIRVRETVDRPNPAPLNNMDNAIANLFGRWGSGDIDSYFAGAGDVYARYGLASQVMMGSGGGLPAIFFGSAADTNLYRSAANTLATDDSFSVGTTFDATGGTMRVGSGSGMNKWSRVWDQPNGRVYEGFEGSVTSKEWQIYAGGTSNAPTHVFKSDASFVVYGTLKFGSSQDVELFRAAADVLRTFDRFSIVRAASANLALEVWKSGSDSNPTFTMDAGGAHNWGAGGASAPDISYYRSGSLQMWHTGRLTVDSSGGSTDSIFRINQSNDTPWGFVLTNSTYSSSIAGGIGMFVLNSGYGIIAHTGTNRITFPPTGGDMLVEGGLFTNYGGWVLCDGHFRVGWNCAQPTINVDRGFTISNSTNDGPNTPSGGAFMWAYGGAIKAKGSSGTTTTVAAADPHCPECGRDFVLEWKNDEYGHLIVCMWCLTNGDVAGVLRKES